MKCAVIFLGNNIPPEYVINLQIENHNFDEYIGIIFKISLL